MATKYESGTYSYLAADSLGSVSVALSSAGSVAASQLFAPYGATRYSSGAMPTSFGFTGQRGDPSGLDYYNARYYDPAVGQFTSADGAQGLNRYGYVKGNPTTMTDPSGNAACAVYADGFCGTQRFGYRSKFSYSPSTGPNCPGFFSCNSETEKIFRDKALNHALSIAHRKAAAIRLIPDVLKALGDILLFGFDIATALVGGITPDAIGNAINDFLDLGSDIADVGFDIATLNTTNSDIAQGFESLRKVVGILSTALEPLREIGTISKFLDILNPEGAIEDIAQPLIKQGITWVETFAKAKWLPKLLEITGSFVGVGTELSTFSEDNEVNRINKMSDKQLTEYNLENGGA